nr:hypothetical protein [Fischerella sp. PCC 9605]
MAKPIRILLQTTIPTTEDDWSICLENIDVRCIEDTNLSKQRAGNILS